MGGREVLDRVAVGVKSVRAVAGRTSAARRVLLLTDGHTRSRAGRHLAAEMVADSASAQVLLDIAGELEKVRKRPKKLQLTPAQEAEYTDTEGNTAHVLDKVAMVFGQMNEPPGARLRVALSGLVMAGASSTEISALCDSELSKPSTIA